MRFRSLPHDNTHSENSSRAPDESGKLALAIEADDIVAPADVLLVCSL